MVHFLGRRRCTLSAITDCNANIIATLSAYGSGALNSSTCTSIIAQQLNNQNTLCINFLSIYAASIAIGEDAVATFLAKFAVSFLGFALLAVTASFTVMTGIGASLTAAAIAALVLGAITTYASGAQVISNTIASFAGLIVGGVATGLLAAVSGWGAIFYPVFVNCTIPFTASCPLPTTAANPNTTASAADDLAAAIAAANAAIAGATNNNTVV